MRILVVSDLHLEFGVPYVPPAADFDLAVLAGDIGNPGTRAVRWARDEPALRGRPVILVAGNHEYYRAEMGRELAAMRQAAAGSNVHVLQGDALMLGGVRFLGCTLWTDFALPVATGDGLQADVGRALQEADRGLNDFRLIGLAAGPGPVRRLRASDTRAAHAHERSWLHGQLGLARAEGGSTVVVTHHAPCARSVAPHFASSWLTPAFASDLPAPLFEGVRLWIHGHTHTSFDYAVGRCRVLCNPRGYPLGNGRFENPAFDPACVVQA